MAVQAQRRTRILAHESQPRAGTRFDVVAIGASAGGLHAISETLRPLPQGFPVSIIFVQHLQPRHKSLLASLLAHVTRMEVKDADDGEALRRGVVYVARADDHLLVSGGKLHLTHTQAVHHNRPSIDLLFESAASAYGSRRIGMVLSGSMRDGSEGLRAIKLAGGTTIAEDPADAEFKSMPQSAIAGGFVDLVLPLQQLAPRLVDLCSRKEQA